MVYSGILCKYRPPYINSTTALHVILMIVGPHKYSPRGIFLQTYNMPPPPNMPNNVTRMRVNGMGGNGYPTPADDVCVGP